MNPVDDILSENDKRWSKINRTFNPVTGEGSIGARKIVSIPDFPIPVQHLPVEMLSTPLVKKIIAAGTVAKFAASISAEGPDAVSHIIEQFTRIRCLHDFPFWAATFVFIKPKGEGGENIRFRLNRPQRHLIEAFEQMRLADRPIRLILLKARQWGGSTATQLYMAWLQLIHRTGLNSLIVGHVKDASTEVKDMFDRMLDDYPAYLLHPLGDDYDANEPKIEGVGKTGNIQRIPQRNCKIKIGTAEKPNSARGGDYNLVHCTEVGLWKTTEGKSPQEIVRSACSGIQYRPYTMIVYESTANGTGNFFHREYLAAKAGETPFFPLFVAWFEIEWNTLPFPDDDVKRDFAAKLLAEKDCDTVSSSRQEPGSYLFQLWQLGATLEAINWYITERATHDDHASMASECPSDDIEAFAFSGRKVFQLDDIEQFRSACRPPAAVGEIYGNDDKGADALAGLRFQKEQNGQLWLWQDVEPDSDDEICTDRYLVVVDVGKGLSKYADFSVITVIDRIYMIDADRPSIVAQWRGHIDMDLLAWKAAQVAAYYNNALLVIESNTLETNNTKGDAEYILNTIRDNYDNLYARRQSAEDIREGRPRKYGFHTNHLTKPVIIHHLKMLVREHLFTERDTRALDELSTYIETDNGGFEAMEGYHDDLLMSRAIGFFVCFKEMEVPRIVQRNTSINKTKPTVSAATL